MLKQKSACSGRYNLSKYEHHAMHARGHDLLAITSDVRLLQAVQVTAVLNTLSCHVSFKHKKKMSGCFSTTKRVTRQVSEASDSDGTLHLLSHGYEHPKAEQLAQRKNGATSPRVPAWLCHNLPSSTPCHVFSTVLVIGTTRQSLNR